MLPQALPPENSARTSFSYDAFAEGLVRWLLLPHELSRECPAHGRT
jgi:hypothetical protein